MPLGEQKSSFGKMPPVALPLSNHFTTKHQQNMTDYIYHSVGHETVLIHQTRILWYLSAANLQALCDKMRPKTPIKQIL